jgi:hypothetical protein
MSADDDVFIAGDEPAAEVQQAIAVALGEEFAPSTDPEPVPAIGVGPTLVFFHDEHDFDDDRDLRFSRYRYWVSVHDTQRDEERQLAVARRVFDAATAAGWNSLLTHDLQVLIARHP